MCTCEKNKTFLPQYSIDMQEACRLLVAAPARHDVTIHPFFLVKKL